jgi:hypothetical protein
MHNEPLESKFENGVLRADALPDRFIDPGTVGLWRTDIDGTTYARRAERDDARYLNRLHSGIESIGKTREQRRAELSAILGREVEP